MDLSYQRLRDDSLFPFITREQHRTVDSLVACPGVGGNDQVRRYRVAQMPLGLVCLVVEHGGYGAPGGVGYGRGFVGEQLGYVVIDPAGVVVFTKDFRGTRLAVDEGPEAAG